MPSIANAADVANFSLGAVKNSAKVYNFHAKQLDDTMHIADTLNERLKELDPDLDVRIPTSRRLRVSLENRGRLARQNHQPILVPKPKRPVAAPAPRQTAETRRMADMERWRNLRAQADYAETHGRYSYEQARKMGKFGEDSSYALQMMQMLQNSQPSQMQQNAMFAQGADMGEQIRNQELEQIKKRRIKENEETAPGTNQHRGMDPNKSMMRKMGGSVSEWWKREMDEARKRREIMKGMTPDERNEWRTRQRLVQRVEGSLRGGDPREKLRKLEAYETAYNEVGPGLAHRLVTNYGSGDKSARRRHSDIQDLKRYIELSKTGEESTEERLRRLEAWDEIQHRKVGKVFGREAGSYWRDHPNSLFGGTGANPWSASARSDAKRRMEILRLRGELKKTAVQTDSLGKNTSPATQGASVDAPMPQTNYAKNTLENEFANRLNKKQLAEMNKLQNQAQTGTTQSSSTTTTSNGTTTTTTTTGLANSGLMAALSLSA